MEHPEVASFREYLRIKSVQPNPDYAGVAAFLEKQAHKLALEFRTFEPVPGKPIVLLTWRGSNSTLPTLLLNSHTDVVPVYEEQWTHPPFAAVKTPDGKIYARGSQDMKCVGSMHLAAIARLQTAGFVPVRTVHVLFVPDEEIGGKDGMGAFVGRPEFAALNVGLALDEGIPSPSGGYSLFYGERAPWWVRITARGPTGHGSGLPSGTSTQRLHSVLGKLLALRESEVMRLATGKTAAGENLRLGDVTSVNITMLEAGVQRNVLPATASAVVDIRVSPWTNLPAFLAQLDAWCAECGCEWSPDQSWDDQTLTPVPPAAGASDLAARLVDAHAAAFPGIPLTPAIFPASTDARFLRRHGIPCFGVTPVEHTPVLLHDHDEYLSEGEFLKGVSWYTAIMRSLLSV